MWDLKNKINKTNRLIDTDGFQMGEGLDGWVEGVKNYKLAVTK